MMLIVIQRISRFTNVAYEEEEWKCEFGIKREIFSITLGIYFHVKSLRYTEYVIEILTMVFWWNHAEVSILLLMERVRRVDIILFVDKGQYFTLI